MNRIILTIGYISSEWVSASDGSTNIQVGDLDHNRTSEHDFEITDDDFVNLTNGNSLSGSMPDIWLQMSAETRLISNGESFASPSLIENVYGIFLEEAESIDNKIVHQQWDVSDFDNRERVFNGHFYFRYLIENQDEIECECLIIAQPS
jgi:hypothetical protein